MDVDDASKYSIHNIKQLEESEIAGCYFCCQIFKPSEVEEFVDEDDTVICPKCGIDSVLGDKSGYEINIETLKKLKERWFKGF